MTENIDFTESVNYSRHLLKCISKFLPNNPNFCPSFKDIENEPYFKHCVKNLISIYMDSDTDTIINDILRLLKDKLSKYEEFPKLTEDEDNDKLLNNPQTVSKFPVNKNVQSPSLNSTHSLPIIEPLSNNLYAENSIDTKKSNSNPSNFSDTNYNNGLSEATQKLMEKYSDIRKDTKFPIRSLGISNYVLIFLKLMLYIFEVNYKFGKAYSNSSQNLN
ncbi:hypothetical protein D499_0N00780 [Hanseniaspora uvarum DSM 2768]|nr:hypothetical protein D499_0N00780 [Hanseniaspora uvarum DSM 2768]